MYVDRTRMKVNSERLQKISLFHNHILPVLNKRARSVWTQFQYEHGKNQDSPPFTLACIEVLRDCAADLRFFPPIKSDQWSEEQLSFALSTTADERKKCAELLKHFGFMDKER